MKLEEGRRDVRRYLKASRREQLILWLCTLTIGLCFTVALLTATRQLADAMRPLDVEQYRIERGAE